jgi:chromosome segregation ATPase
MNRHEVHAVVSALFLFSLTGCATSGDLDPLRADIRSLRGAVQSNEKQNQALRTKMEAMDAKNADATLTKQVQSDLKTLEAKWAFVIEELGNQTAAMRKTLEEAKRARASEETGLQARGEDLDAVHRQHAMLTTNLAGLQSEVSAYSTRMQSLLQVLLRTYHAEIVALQGQAREIEQTANALEPKGEKRR